MLNVSAGNDPLAEKVISRIRGTTLMVSTAGSNVENPPAHYSTFAIGTHDGCHVTMDYRAQIPIALSRQTASTTAV